MFQLHTYSIYVTHTQILHQDQSCRLLTTSSLSPRSTALQNIPLYHHPHQQHASPSFFFFFSYYTAIPQSTTTFWPVILLLMTNDLTWSATSAGSAVDLSAALAIVASTLALGKRSPLLRMYRQLHSLAFAAKTEKTHHSVIINPGLILLHLTFFPQISASPLVK